MESTGERFVPCLSGQIKYEHLHRYAIASQLTRGKAVLDLACGEGYGANLLARTAASVVGVDNSPEVISYASRTYIRSNLSFILGACDSIPLQTASVDVVVSFETIEHHDKHQEMMCEVRRVLRPKGLLVISTPDRFTYSDEPGYKNPFHLKELYYDEFRSLLKKFFRVVEIYGQRIAAASFVHALDGSGADSWAAYEGDSARLSRGTCNLQSPMYFIALCSDDIGVVESHAFTSVYLDSDDDLLKNEWMARVRTLEAHLHEGEGVIANAEQQYKELRRQLEDQRAQLEDQRDTLARRVRTLEAHLHEREGVIANAEQQHKELRRQLEDQRNIVNGIYASHGWRALSLYYKIRDRLLPLGTLRRAAAKTLWTPRIAVEGIRLVRDMRLIAASGLFDREWYLQENPDVAKSGVNPLKHYLRSGAAEGRNPNSFFDSERYLQENSDAADSRMNPLVHYLRRGAVNSKERSAYPRTAPIDAACGATTPNSTLESFVQDLYRRVDERRGENRYVPPSNESLDSRKLSIRAVAFYLPQFHPIPENDRWWGKNFTEWKNVTRAVPQFVGHYQPRLPSDLGFYDLRIPETMKHQVEIAKQYGISAFCFHYYWFAGRRLLEKPLEQFLAEKPLDIGFCVCWANENWTRRWDGGSGEVLIAQQHSPQDDVAFINALLPIFRDARYMRINGRPLLIVYRFDLLPDPATTVARWRATAKNNGIPDVYIVGAHTFGTTDLSQYGVDAAVEFPPHGTLAAEITGTVNVVNPSFRGKVFDYATVASCHGKLRWNDATTFKTVMPSWDNTARLGPRAHVFHGSKPSLYASWLKDACEVTREYPADERLVFINAWNEWAEGAHLEPDARYGYAYLRATANVLAHYYHNDEVNTLVAANRSRFTKQSDVAVILHSYHEEVACEIVEGYLSKYSKDIDVFATLRPDVGIDCVKYLQKHLKNVLLLPGENRGRDIRPFLSALRRIEQLGYLFGCKIHTKKSPELEHGKKWREELLSSLWGGENAVEAARQRFQNQHDLGLLVPFGSLTDLSVGEINIDNRAWLDKLLVALGRPDLIGNYRTFFPAGSMYWFRVAALAGIHRLVFPQDEFEFEVGQLDGTLAHAIERLVALYASSRGYGFEEFDATAIKSIARSADA